MRGDLRALCDAVLRSRRLPPVRDRPADRGATVSPDGRDAPVERLGRSDEKGPRLVRTLRGLNGFQAKLHL